MKNKPIGVITTHIYPSKGYGGPSVSCAELIYEWSNSNTILLTSSDASLVSPLSVSKLNFNRSNVITKLYKAYFFKRFGFGFGAILSIFYICIRCRTIYINGIATWPTTIGAFLCFFFSRDYVVSLRGGLMQEHIEEIKKSKKHKLLFYKILTIPLLKKAKAIHCSSELEKQYAKDFIRTDQYISVIPNGVKIPNFNPTKMPLKNGVVFGYFGRISEEKGINEFLKIWLKIADTNSRFVIAGSGSGIYFQEFLALIEKHGERIEFKGYLDKRELSYTMNDCHFIVLPSGIKGNNNRENFGNSVAEALALGRPIIVSRGLAWDDIEDEGAGFLFARNFKGAQKVIDQTTSVREQNFDQMCKNARDYAIRKLDICYNAEKMREMLINT